MTSVTAKMAHSHESSVAKRPSCTLRNDEDVYNARLRLYLGVGYIRPAIKEY